MYDLRRVIDVSTYPPHDLAVQGETQIRAQASGAQ
jgi:hypothetical protein